MMQITIDELTKLIIPKEFGTDDEDYGDTLNPVVDQVEYLGGEFAYGASKFVIFISDKEVAKIPFNGEFSWNCDIEDYDFDEFKTTDYCKIEADYYEKAVEWGIEEFFAGTRFAGYTKDHTPFYISERIKYSLDNYRDSVSEESIKTARNYADSKDDFNWRRLPDIWLALALDRYGVEKVDKFVEFLKKFNINDLHYGNVGIRENGDPVLIDYSGFNS